MPELSAHLDSLWPELELLDAIRVAQGAGFDAVETDWPYVIHALEVALVLNELDMSMAMIDTPAGHMPAGDFGIAAVGGRETEARAGIDRAFAYAVDTSTKMIHVLAGRIADSETSVFIENLRYAADRAAGFGMQVLIGPVPVTRATDYFLASHEDAAVVVDGVDRPNVKLLLECSAASEFEVASFVDRWGGLIGHVRFSAGDAPEPILLLSVISDALDCVGYDGSISIAHRPLRDSVAQVRSVVA